MFNVPPPVTSTARNILEDKHGALISINAPIKRIGTGLTRKLNGLLTQISGHQKNRDEVFLQFLRTHQDPVHHHHSIYNAALLSKLVVKFNGAFDTLSNRRNKSAS